MSKEAMKLAWEAEEKANPQTRYNSWCRGYEAALREALEKPDFWEGYVPEPVKPAPVQQKLIGWRTDDYLMETSDAAKAKNWETHHKILPIFEGDPNTKLAAPQPAQQALDKKAENARELGLDYEPAQQALECQHRWEEVPDKLLYKCARCGAFMVKFK